MTTVKLNRIKLLEVVKANREKHRTQFLKAQDGYRKQAIAELDKMLEEAKTGKRIRRMVELDEPMDMTDSYDTVIGMLEMSVDEEVLLSQHQFDNYVRDKWSWSGQVELSNSKYI